MTTQWHAHGTQRDLQINPSSPVEKLAKGQYKPSDLETALCSPRRLVSRPFPWASSDEVFLGILTGYPQSCLATGGCALASTKSADIAKVRVRMAAVLWGAGVDFRDGMVFNDSHPEPCSGVDTLGPWIRVQ